MFKFLDDQGRIPAQEECPFRGQCEIAEAGGCYHKGKEHEVSYSCGVARAFDMTTKMEPILTAPHNGTSVRVVPMDGYDHAFYQDGIWRWHTVHSKEDGDCVAGPVPSGWFPS